MKPSRQQWAWAFYDWANSAFATTVIAGFFPIFFNRYWADGVAPQTQTLILGLTATVASVVVMLMAPFLGALADRRAQRKRYLLGFMGVGVLATAALFLVAHGQWLAAVLLSILGRIGFFGSLSFYDSLLVSVARPEQSDRVSALGFGLGYLGGGLLFALNVAMALKPAAFGLDDAAMATRVSFLLVAAWWLAFSWPLARHVQEQGPAPGAVGWAGLMKTLADIRRRRDIWLFLVAYWLYIDGVDTIIVMAVDFGQKLGFSPNSLIVALLLVQFVGFPAAVAFGWIGERIGTRRAILVTLAVYAAVTLWASFLQNERQFFLMAAAIALVQGGVQSLSRSYYSRLIPRDRAGEYFGFYNMLGKFAAVLGPLAVGLGAVLLQSTRLSILVLLVFFVAGGLLLTRVREPQPA